MAFGALTVTIIVTKGINGFGYSIQVTNRANLGDITGFGTGCILAIRNFIGVFASNDFIEPTALHLCGLAVIGTNYAVNGNFVTNGGLRAQRVKTNLAVVGVNAVNIQLVAFGILNIRVAMRGAIKRNDNTGYIVLVSGISVFGMCHTQSDCLLDGERGTSCGRNNCGTSVALIIGCIAGMTGCSNGFLCYDNFATNGAMLTFGKTGCFAFRSNCIVNNLGVTGCEGYLLCYDNITANGAVRTFGKAVFFALRSNCCVSNLGVTESVGGVGCVFITASCANVFGITVCGTSGIDYSYSIVVFMVELRNGFFVNIIACRAYSVFLTFFLFGSIFIYDPVAVGVTGCSNGLLCYDSITANGAVRTFGKTVFFAFRSNCCVNDLGVRSQSYFFLFYDNFITNGALGSIGETGFGAGSILAGNGCFGMTGCGVYLLCYDSITANGAVRTFGKTVFFAIRSNCCINDFGMRCSAFITAFVTGSVTSVVISMLTRRFAALGSGAGTGQLINYYVCLTCSIAGEEGGIVCRIIS